MDAFIFVPLLAVTWIYSLFFSGLVSHYFLTIVESSGTQYAQNVDWSRRSFRALVRDGIDWPEAEYIDWFWKGFYMLYIVGVWMGPALIISRMVLGASVWISVIAGVVFWLFFPVGVLSTMMSTSRWNVFWPPLFVCFAKRPTQTFIFYAFSFLPLAIIIATLDLILVHTSKAGFIYALILSPFAMGALFLYARLLGRLALSLSYTREADAIETAGAKGTRRKPKRQRPVNAYDESTRWSMPTEPIDTVAANAQPSDLPPIETPYDGPVTGYNINFGEHVAPQEEVKPKQIIHHFDDEDDTPITVAPPEIITERVRNPERERLTEVMANPPQHVMDLYARDRPTEPANPFGSAVVTFFADPKTVQMWLTGTVGLAFLALLFRVLDSLAARMSPERHSMIDVLADYPVVIEQVVAWADMDSFAHVNNVVYFRYFENARVEYIRRLGWWDSMKETGIGPIVSATQARYRRPVKYPDVLRCGAKLLTLGSDRFTLKHTIVSTTTGELVTDGDAVVVIFDYRNNTKVKIPPDLLERMRTLEGQLPT